MDKLLINFNKFTIINTFRLTMRKNILYALLLSLTLGSCGEKMDDANYMTTAFLAQPTPPATEGPLRLLFVGNSHTEYFASFPKMLEALAKSNNKSLEVMKLVDMGVSIDQILVANQEEVDNLFSATDTDGNYFDFLILQESTPVVIQELTNYQANVKSVHDLITANSPGVATYIYGLTAPFDYHDPDYSVYQSILQENGVIVAQSTPNTGYLNFAGVLGAAYRGKEGYVALVDGKDRLRFTDSSHHMLNDAVFINSLVLYKTLFGEMPEIPQQLPLSTGTGDKDIIQMMNVATGISNPNALIKIAANFK